MTTIDPFAALGGTPASAAQTRNEAGAADRFLKLLVTQMQNQDPLNPLDNAQVTSQMAQISTVTGIDKLNGTVAGLTRQFMQMQALQGASLVGHDVTLEGDRIAVAGGTGVAGFELAGTADRVKVELLSPAGRVVDTLELGALSAGRHGFEWDAAAKAQADGDGYRFRVVATAGATAVASTALMRDRVEAVSLSGDRLTLETRHAGLVDYQAVKAFN
jgi:flagellar basal-body rod modification protein FlgD